MLQSSQMANSKMNHHENAQNEAQRTNCGFLFSFMITSIPFVP
ncbi:hypothetical protein U1P98_15355 [Lysinibacillus irui]|uniref:Uncharacterized protein n=1 Tax=Lysinibacillus irui TaxID=2998077 RepID=A0ABU5NNU4_9BACI|nr:hypothetical protein [Lysinibacillus irui]MEA0555307.1 hypothetical protein [Lysinibacillus irui]MEA0977685.1 hypothetical protein [Lysinibacillus irui]MEA1043839.1 hypothetical protein [Lysinibacillus irui]